VSAIIGVVIVLVIVTFVMRRMDGRPSGRTPRPAA
jgi:hypothetical protein